MEYKLEDHKFRTARLGDIINLKRGYDLPVQNRIEGNVPILSSSGITGYHTDYKVLGPGVTIGRSGQLGGSFYTDRNFWPLNTTLYVEDFKGNDVLYIYYLLKIIDFKKLNAGSSVPTLNRNHAHEIQVPFCNSNTQIIIANILGNLDKKNRPQQ